MLKAMNTDTAEPSSMKPTANGSGDNKTLSKSHQDSGHNRGFLYRVQSVFGRSKNGADTLREAIEEYIEEESNSQETSVASHEKALISNVLNLRDMTVTDVMIPRADIVAIEVNASQDILLELLEEKQFSRIPVYRETMDDILGTVHIKDILAFVHRGKGELQLKEKMRPVPVVSPSLPVLDLLLKMQRDKKHMVLVVDEYGGIEGLVTIGDVMEDIVVEIDDEFDQDMPPQIIERPDGSLIVDARYDIEDFEARFGPFLNDEEREDIDTLGGLVFFTASRIPARGEVIHH